MQKFVENYSGLKIMLMVLSAFMSCLFLAPFVYSFTIDTSLYTVFYTLAIACVLLIYFYHLFDRYIDNIINREIKSKRKKHIREFFDFLEQNEEFRKNVLRRELPIIDDEGKEIGQSTIYQAYAREFDKYQYKALDKE